MERKRKRRPWSGACNALVTAVAMSLLMVPCLAAAERLEPAAETATMDGDTAVAAASFQGRTVIPMGRAVGIKLFSDGVLVVGLTPIQTENGTHCPGRDCGLKEGDVITHIDGCEVDTIEQVQAALTSREGEPLSIQAVRGEQKLQLTAAPVANEKGVYQLGVWLRDSMAGIGTMTFYDPDSGVFGALGHGINDVDTSKLMPLESGGIMRASISDVKRGESGDPGELHGQFDMSRDVGELYANTKMGIFGKMQKGSMEVGKPLPVAKPEEIHTGRATILSNIRGDQVEEFEVQITKVSQGGDGTKNLMVEVTDPDLLASTGGIVQGMSGSPIIQDGKIIGAVTHVLVNDPTRGYGIFIENMLGAAA